MHTLISDGGAMTVGRRTANYTWGAFEVTLQEGLEQAEQLDDRLQDGYIYRPDDRGHGRAELTFVRADARIDMNAAKSDLEQTLDGASERTKGEAYYTRQISGVGLGRARLGVDVRQGDMVRVLLWSKYLELPVTAIIPGKSVDGTTPVMAAQVGGQMLRDAELLSKRNSEIDTAIAVEKRTRLNQVGAVDKKATQAKGTAESAKSEAKDAKQVATTANSAATQAQRSADGKSTVFYGATTPTGAKAGDTWFKDLAGGGTVLMQYVGGKWVEKVNAKAIDDKLAANESALADNDAALTELNDVTLPALDKRLENNERAVGPELTAKLATLKDELKALDTDVARDVASKLATLETKLANADKDLKQDLRGELAALDDALSGDLATKLAGLKDELEAADTAGAKAVATTLAQLENRLKAADQAVKSDLVKQLEELEEDLAALDTAVGENLAAKLAALKTELKQADTAVTTTLRGELSTLKTQLQNADAAVTTDLTKKIDSARKALEDADKATNTDLSKRLEDARKDLKTANDTVAADLAGVDAIVSRQRAGNLFPDPFFADDSWNGAGHNNYGGYLSVNASGVQTGRYYQPEGLKDISIQLEPGASYLLTADVRFGGTAGISYFNIYARLPKADGTGFIPTRVGRIDRVVGGDNGNSYNWNAASTVLTIPTDIGTGPCTLGFFVEASAPDGVVYITNVRLTRAADSSLIIDGAVTASKVQAGVIDADHIAAGAIVATKLAANSVVAGKIAANAVVADSIAANSITTAKIAANAVTANEVAAGTLTAKEIKAGTLTATEIAAGAITTVKLAADSVVAGKIAASAVTTQAIAANAVTANEIAAGTITAGNIKAGAITTDKIATNAVTSNEIAAGTITAGNIASNAITAVKIGANQITTAKIAAGAVTATELQAENATIDKLWANGIAAKSITTNRIVVAGGSNLLPDISSLIGIDRSSIDDPFPAPWGMNTSHPSMWLQGTRGVYLQRPIKLTKGERYRLTYSAYASVDGTKHYIQTRAGDVNGTEGTAVPIDTVVGSGSSSNSYIIQNETIDKSWKDYRAEFVALSSQIVYLYFYSNHSNGTTNTDGYQWFRDLRLEKMTGGTLIEDGAITTGKIAANAVTANAIAADAVTANAIKAGEISANHIKAGEISARELKAEEATIDKLWANGIAAKSIQTASLSVGAANLYRDPALLTDDSFNSWRKDTGGYGGGGCVVVPESTSQTGSYDTLGATKGRPTRLVPGVTYVLSVMVKPTKAVPADSIRLFMRAYTSPDATGSYKWASPSTRGNESAISAGTWTRIETTFVLPEGSEYFVLGFYAQASAKSEVVFSDPAIVRQYGATFIEDGAITTGKVAANAVTANALAADAVTARSIKAGEITGTHISAGKITSRELATDSVTANAIKAGEITGSHIKAGEISSRELTIENGFIKNVMIENGAVNNAKIANLDAGKITTGTINANRIGANTITGKHLAVDTIEANQIKAGVFTQVANSVLPLIPGEAKAAWTAQANSSGTQTIGGQSRTWYRFNETGKPVYRNMVAVDPDAEYEFSAWIQGQNGSILFVEMFNQNGDHAIESGGIDNTDPEAEQTGTSYLVRSLTTPPSFRQYKTRVKFKPGTEFVYVGSIYGNHPSGPSGSAWIADMKLVPDVVSQSEVDARQDETLDALEDNSRYYRSEISRIVQRINTDFPIFREARSGGLVAGQDEPGIMTTTSSSITCVGSWSGHILVHTLTPGVGSSGSPSLSVRRFDVTGSDRTFSIPSGSQRSGSAAIHWFKDLDYALAVDLESGASTPSAGVWTTVSSTSQTIGSRWNLSTTVGWDAANNNSRYGIRVLVNGSVVAQVAPRSGLGPLTPIGSGYRTQSLSVSGMGTGGNTRFEIQAYVSGGTASQRKVRQVEGTLDWTKAR